VWRWKDWIDRRFMRRFNELVPMPEATAAPPATAIPLDAAEHSQVISAVAMRCGGCGAKVGATVLSRALARLHPTRRDDVLIGLHAPDDAALLRVPAGSALVHSVDFFRAFIDDPWLFGRSPPITRSATSSPWAARRSRRRRSRRCRRGSRARSRRRFSR
jgi:selenide,water dikinase